MDTVPSTQNPCPYNLYPKCWLWQLSSQYGQTHSTNGSTREKQRIEEALTAEQMALEEAKSTVEAMDKWLPELESSKWLGISTASRLLLFF